MSDELHIRLRHTQGDIGPIEVPGIDASNYEGSKVCLTCVSKCCPGILACREIAASKFKLGLSHMFVSMLTGSLTVLQFKERVLSDWPRGTAHGLQ